MLHRVDASWKVRGGEQVPGPAGDSARLLIAGDTHGNLDWIGTLCKLAARHGCQGIVQLGDFGFWPDQQIWRSERRLVINNRWLDAVAAVAADTTCGFVSWTAITTLIHWRGSPIPLMTMASARFAAG